MRKTASLLLIVLYIFGFSRLGVLYSTHELFHYITEEHHSHESECNEDCLIIKVAENSENNTETKFFKISTENFSTHITYSFTISTPIHEVIIFVSENSYPQKKTLGITTPPPKV